MSNYSSYLENLIEQFRSLPGIGYKSAVRLAFHIINSSEEKVAQFIDAVTSARQHIQKCEICRNISDEPVCAVCGDAKRDQSTICVVESPKDVLTFEKIKEFNGVYHILHGVISPLGSVTPDDIYIKDLILRCGNGNINEIIIATGSSVESEATAVYISKLTKPLGIKTTRLAFGLPVGGEIEYADEMTLFKALEGRREI